MQSVLRILCFFVSLIAASSSFAARTPRTLCADEIVKGAALQTEYAKSHMVDAVENLVRLVALETTSETISPDEMDRRLHPLAALLHRTGLNNIEVIRMLDGEGGRPAMPFLTADWLHAGADKPTVFLYAHADVVAIPDSALPLWKTPPFKATLVNDRLYGRGTTDNKSGIVIFLAAIEAYLKTQGTLPVNIKLVIEAEEELGSPNMERFLQLYPQKWNSDIVFIADNGNFSLNHPGIAISARGHMRIDLQLAASQMGNHSGVVGGAFTNPQMELARLIGTLIDRNGRVAVPGISQSVRPMTSAEHAAAAPFLPSVDDYRGELTLLDGVKFLDHGTNLHPFLIPATQPTINVGNIVAGNGTVGQIPAFASATLGVRTVADMDVDETFRMIREHLERENQSGLHLDVTLRSHCPWWRQGLEHPDVKAAMELFACAWGASSQPIMDGGSIPLLGHLTHYQPKSPIIAYGAWDPQSGMHIENENVHLPSLEKSILSTIVMFQYLGTKRN